MKREPRYLLVERPDKKAVIDFLRDASVEIELDGHTLSIEVRDVNDYNSLSTFVVELSEPDEE